MVERLRAFLDRPLDPKVGRTVAVLASAITIAFAAVLVLGFDGGDEQPRSSSNVATEPIESAPSAGKGTAAAPERTLPTLASPPEPSATARQDPQDRPGSAAAARAHQEVRRHRALQHVPYRRGRVEVKLAGARRGKAVLQISAPSKLAARRGWREFLNRFGDSGHSYVPIFAGASQSGRRRNRQ